MAPSSGDAQKFLRGLARFHQSAEVSDFTIRCQDRSWPVHRLVLILHSSVLAKSCSGDFRETSQASIDLKEHDPACVEQMIHYLYHFDYDYAAESGFEGDEPAFHVEIAVLADKYDIAALKNAAFTKFKNSLQSVVHTPATFAEAAILAYDYTTALPDFCRFLVDLALKHDDHANDGFSPELEALMEKCHGLAVDVACAIRAKYKDTLLIVAQRTPYPLYRCPVCTRRRQDAHLQHNVVYSCTGCRGISPGHMWLAQS